MLTILDCFAWDTRWTTRRGVFVLKERVAVKDGPLSQDTLTHSLILTLVVLPWSARLSLHQHPPKAQGEAVAKCTLCSAYAQASIKNLCHGDAPIKRLRRYLPLAWRRSVELRFGCRSPPLHPPALHAPGCGSSRLGSTCVGRIVTFIV